MRRHTGFILIIAGILLFSGCISQSSLDPSKYIAPPKSKMTATDTFLNVANCKAFYCKQSPEPSLLEKAVLTQLTFGLYAVTSIFAPKPTLEGGKCWFETFDPYTEEGDKKLEATVAGTDLNEKSLSETLKDMVLGSGSAEIRSFMIGSGPNLAAADEARRYCGGTLGFAVQWLGGSKTQLPKDISSEALRGVMRADIIPFITYNIPNAFTYTENLSKNLSGIGPVFVAPGTEYDFASSQQNSPVGSFSMIKQYCENCLAVAFIGFNDTATLEYLANRNEMKYIDVIAYGVNFNDFDCDKDSIYLAISNFTETISEKWKKPSIIPYFRAKREGNCTVNNIARVYESMYATIPFLTAQGLIGFAIDDTPERFKNDSVLDYQGIAWFKNCKSYYEQVDPAVSKQASLLFSESGDSGGLSKCTVLTSLSAWADQKCDMDYSVLSLPEPVDSSVFAGDVCLGEDETKVDEQPSMIVNESVGQVLDGYERFCEYWSMPIRQFSSEFSFDPSIVRSIVWQENGFTPYKPLMQTGPECKSCDGYSGSAYDLCCGTERLKYYYDLLDKTYYLSEFYGSHDSYKSCGGEPEWAKAYFAVYGYLYGDRVFKQHLGEHMHCISAEGCSDDGCSFSFSDRKTKQIVAGAETMREACGICKERELEGDAPWYKKPSQFAAAMPLDNPKCTVPFGKNMGTYWLSGIILNDEVGASTVYSVAGGTVSQIKEGPRRGKTVMIESGNLLITYSSLATINVTKGQFLTAGQKLGEIDESLRLEVCEGGNCVNPLLGTDRDFIDPAQYLRISCPES
jgi:hypothetical protein